MKESYAAFLSARELVFTIFTSTKTIPALAFFEEVAPTTRITIIR